EIAGEKLFVYEIPKSRSLRKDFYWIVYQSFRTGEFSQLRKCIYCTKLLVLKDPRRKYCSIKCKDTYNNTRRTGEGYFAHKQKEKRADILEKAKSLLKSGNSKMVVQEKTGLSLRAVQILADSLAHPT